MNPLQESERLLQAAIATPGLVPRWSRGAGPEALTGAPAGALDEARRWIADPAALVGQAAAAWPPLLVALWRAGLVYFVDEKSRLSAPLDMGARRLVIRDSTLGAFSSLAGDGVLLDRSLLRSHVTLEGPVALVETLVHQYVALGPVVVALSSAFQAFAKAQRGIRIDRSLIGSHSAVDGGNHPEKIPLGPQRRVFGARIGPDAWIGQHVSVTAGAVIGAGVVVSPHTSISGPIPDHVLVTGNPARAHPIDFNIRGLRPEEARREGREQGSIAVDLPSYGRHHGALRAPECLEIDYPEHATLRGLASENLLHFQAGVLESVVAQLFPDYHAQVGFAAGKTVRFRIDFDRPLVRHRAPGAEVVVSRTARPLEDGLTQEHLAALERLRQGPLKLAALLPASGHEAFMSALQQLAVRGYVEPAFFRRGAPSGILQISLDAPALARLWDLLASWDAAPLPDHQPAAAPPKPAPPAPAPSGSTLAVVAGMLQEILGAKLALDVDAPFYAIGIDSLTAADLATRIEQVFKIEPPDVFANNTVRMLSEAVERCLRQ